jgi:hypothetical protein
MKKLVTLITLAWATLASAQTASQFITAGRNDLALTNWWGADTNFAAALAAPNGSTNEDANALKAVTRLLVLPQTPAGSNFLVTLGFPKTNRWLPGFPLASLPKDANGEPVFPANYNSATIVSFFRANILTAITNSAANLAAITDPGYTLTLSANETLTESVTVDYGDIQMLRAMLSAAQFFGYTINENNLSTVIPTVEGWIENGTFTFQMALANYPNILSLQNTGDLPTSKSALTNAIALYFAASDFIRNRPADATGRLFTLDAGATNEEAQFRAILTNVLSSLASPTQFAPDNLSSTINASRWFSGAVSFNKLLPKFNGDVYVNNSLPDYTFGGILPYQPAYKTETYLRNLFPSYAGIYYGSVYDETFGDPSAGNFAVFINANQQVTVVGYDMDSFNNINGQQSGGISAQFTLDPHGDYWEFNSNTVQGVSGNGWVGKDGSFGGELDFTNGDSVWLDNGWQLPVLGQFQNAAGNYSGTWSSSQFGSGTLKAVVSAGGGIVFCIFHNGAQNDGGQGQIDSNNQFTTTDTASGSTISGTLNISTLQINGNFSNPYGSGTWTMSRAANAPFDVPPVITADLVAGTNIALGSPVTFSLSVTGSPPLSYQWYFNGNAIPGAMTNKLVVSNQLWTATGDYFISAKVANIADGTNSQVCTVNVTAETVPPTVAITNVTSGMLVSNAAFTVMGGAGDNVAVSNVWVSANSASLFTPAATANNWANWSAPVTLAAGTNIVRAYAVDSSGNLSTTNSVSLVYVMSAALTVRTNGLGTITPNYNGALLQIGKTYSLTAAAGTGFVFTNWTGGTGLPLDWLTNGTTVQFLMQSNLVLQANFVDTSKPALSITNLAAGQRVSNAVFVVRGTAGDNWQVGNVAYQLNGGVWSNALTANNWTNWSGSASLVPGTNAVLAYATDTTGNRSTTNGVAFQFVVTNQLGVQATGLGTLSPNYSNAWLEIGRNYTMTAAPGSGFIATNWVISTNWLGGRTTNNAAVQFMMASNLTLQVNFLDISKPTLVVSSPAAGQHMTNALANLKGTASDNWKVAGVWYQLNGNAWDLASTTNGYTNWNRTVALLAGTNTLKLYAQDLGGNYSTTNSLSVVSSNAFKLQLTFAAGQPFSGSGLNFALQVSTNVNGHILVSTDLLRWTVLTNFTGSNAMLNFRDAAATNFNQRFYRAVTP